ncbi:MAG: translation elongation factor Ts [Pirellulaceae bacterium]|nr:translation elongation factor Ts [Pirellulaceae bacterium]
MAAISAADVKALRERTGVSLGDCKKALVDADGDQKRAIEILRERGEAIQLKRGDRATSFGRFGLYVGLDKTVGAMVELKCESAPVAGNQEFCQLADDLAQQYALTPEATTPDDLLALPSPSKEGMTLGEQKDDLFNRIREVFKIGRMVRHETPCNGYFHNSGTIAGVLVSVEGGNDQAVCDIAMHIAAMQPEALSRDEICSERAEQERKFLTEQVVKSGKPEQFADKIVEGQMRKFFGDCVLLEQPFVKDDSQTVEKFAQSQEMKILAYSRWEIGQEEGED